MNLKFEIKLRPELELKVLQKLDAPLLFALVDKNREHLRQWLPWVDDTIKVADSLGFIEKILDEIDKKESLNYGIWFKNNLTGVIGFHKFDWPNRKTSMGYWISKEYEGKGFISESCQALLDYVFGDLKLNRVAVHCATNNIRSRAIPEKLGFFEEGILRASEWLYDHFVDHAVYAMFADQWEKRTSKKSR